MDIQTASQMHQWAKAEGIKMDGFAADILKLAHLYLTDPAFRAKLEEFVWQQNQR